MSTKKEVQESDRELLIRIDERTAHLPHLVKTVGRHDRELLVAKVLFVVILVLVSAKYQWVSDLLAKMLAS